MTRQRYNLITRILLPTVVVFGLLSAYSFLIFIPGLEDAARNGYEPSGLLRSLLPYTLGVLAVSAVLFVITASYSIKLEKSRARMEANYLKADERYQTLIETSADGFIFIGDDGPDGGG